MENWSEFECAGRGKTVVFVNGCFDLLHSGHVSLLQFAKLQGDILVVGINSDASVKLSAKGEMSLPARPIISENDRLFLVKALRCVDFAVLFEESDPGKLIERVRPDIIVKGSDYVGKDIPEQWAIDACGCRIIWYDRVNGVSTTGIVEGIRIAFPPVASRGNGSPNCQTACGERPLSPAKTHKNCFPKPT